MRIYRSAAEIAAGIEREAAKINEYYRDATPGSRVLVVDVLKGATIFFADLIRRLKFPLELDFVRATSYGDERVSSGIVRLTKDVETSVVGRRVLIVEDLIDTGRSLAKLRDHFLNAGAAEVCVAVLVAKKKRRAVDVPIEFCVLEAEDVYLVGYGLDDAENGRQLPDLWAVDGAVENDATENGASRSATLSNG